MDTLLNWDITEKKVYSNNTELKSHKAIFRNDNGKLLNVAKESYTPTTNARFKEVVNSMQDITGFPLQCYDEFDSGKKVLAFLKCTEPIQVLGYDFEDYMLIGNSHDSSTGFFIGNSSTMVRCQNRFSRVFRKLNVYHTRNHDSKIESLLASFRVFMQERKATFATMEAMSKVYIDAALQTSLVERLANMTFEESMGLKEISTRKQNLIQNMHKCINKESDVLGDNALGFFQGITNYTTHVRKNQVVFCNALGGAAVLNEKAFQLCEELINPN